MCDSEASTSLSRHIKWKAYRHTNERVSVQRLCLLFCSQHVSVQRDHHQVITCLRSPWALFVTFMQTAVRREKSLEVALSINFPEQDYCTVQRLNIVFAFRVARETSEDMPYGLWPTPNPCTHLHSLCPFLSIFHCATLLSDIRWASQSILIFA
jgi:hypothetical protein